MDYKIILASGSPRRTEILKTIGIDFTVVKSNADERTVNPNGIEVSTYVQELALLKAADVAGKLVANTNTLIIGADTVVACDGKILGKPKDEEDAIRMLKELSGKSHEVYTGICVFRKSDGLFVCETECTKVYFAELTDKLISDYVQTREPLDKAGAYGIQEKGAILVEKIDGDYFNVVGLPIRRLVNLLKREFEFEVL